MTVVRNVALELVLMLAIIASGAYWGAAYWRVSRDAGHVGSFYQSYFEPAVMVACGKGFVIAQPQPKPLADFLLLRADRFDCRDIPADAVLGQKGLYQGAWRYLLTTVGVAWSVLGVSWSGMAPLFGVLFGLTLASAYGIFRLAVGPALALVGTGMLAISSLQLGNLQHLRDYAKAPFVLVLLLVLGISVIGTWTWRRAIGTGLAAGVVLGLGYGFRTDFLVFIPFVVATLLLFAGPFVRTALRKKVAACGSFVVMFLVCAWPILTVVNRSGGCQWHVALLGVSDEFHDSLRIRAGPYEVGYAYADGFVYREVASYGARTGTALGHVEYCSPEYDTLSRRYLSALVATIPGDFATRAFASVIGTVLLPTGWTDAPLPDRWRVIYAPRTILLKVLRPISVVAAIAAMSLVALRNRRYALFLLFALLYLGGYPAVQYDNRHYFHLEFIGWLAFLIVLYAALQWATVARRVGVSDAMSKLRPGPPFFTRLLGAAVIAVVCFVLPVLALRWYQAARLEALFESYIAAPKRAIALDGADEGESMTRADVKWFPHGAALPLQRSALIEVRMNALRCLPDATVTFRYSRNDPGTDFTRTLAIPPSPLPEPTRLFFPVFDQFQGIEVNGLAPGCFAGVSQVANVEQFPLLFAATLSPRWKHGPLYQRLAFLER